MERRLESMTSSGCRRVTLGLSIEHGKSCCHDIAALYSGQRLLQSFLRALIVIPCMPLARV